MQLWSPTYEKFGVLSSLIELNLNCRIFKLTWFSFVKFDSSYPTSRGPFWIQKFTYSSLCYIQSTLVCSGCRLEYLAICILNIGSHLLGHSTIYRFFFNEYKTLDEAEIATSSSSLPCPFKGCFVFIDENRRSFLKNGGHIKR